MYVARFPFATLDARLAFIVFAAFIAFMAFLVFAGFMAFMVFMDFVSVGSMDLTVFMAAQLHHPAAANTLSRECLSRYCGPWTKDGGPRGAGGRLHC